MANEIIRPTQLPARADPVASEVVPSDNGATVGGVTWEDGVNAAVPPASQAEAEAGVINTKRMTPLTTKQAVDAQVPPKIGSAISALNLGSASQAQVEDFATAVQGAKADSAVQPSRTVGTGTGLTGGGDLSADRTISLTPGTIASLGRADSSVQTVNGNTPDGSGNVVVNAEFLQDQNSVTTAMAESFAPTVEWVRTAGYAAVGDGGGALYKRVASEPAHAGKFQSADGAWWELAEDVLRPEMFGEDGAAFDDALYVARVIGVQRGTGPALIHLLNGEYAPAGGFDPSDSLIYVAPGSKLYGNTTSGFTQRISTLPPNFNDFQMDPVHVVRYFDAQVKDTVDPAKTNGVLKAGAPGTFAHVFGMNSPAIGTPLALRATMEVYDVADPDIGYNEIGGVYNHIVVHGDRSQPAAKYSIWAHDTIAMTGKQRTKWFGASFRYHNMANADPTGGTDGAGNTWEGLSGISVMQRPLYAEDAGYTGFDPSDSVYPMAAGLTISGYGGPQSATDGAHPDALHGFYVGLQVGGNNSPYLAYNARSKIRQGIIIQDYTLSGLLITAPHPDFNPDPSLGSALTIAGNAGCVDIGVDSPTQDAAIHVRGAADGNIKLYALSGSMSSTINFGGLGVLGSDLSRGGVDNFGYYHASSGRYGFVVNPQGHFTLPAIPVAPAGLATGAIWSDGGTLKIV